MADKVDHLKLCNEHRIPFQEFEAMFCSRCLQPECARSQAGKSKFDQRVTQWEDRLFLKVLQMNPEDERYRNITAQKFLVVNPSNPGTQTAWMDPRDVEPTKVISLPEPAPVVVVAPPPVLEEKLPELDLIPITPEPPAPVLRPQVLRNTPNQPRQMIGGAAPPAPASVLDPWQPKQPLKPGEQLVEPGARIKFGKS